MKKVLASLLTVTTAAVFLTSCKKDITAVPTENSPATAARGGGGGIIPAPVYTITRRSNDTLTYYNDGRLAKVQHSAASYTQYNYGFNTITANTFVGSKLDAKIIYQTDVQTGRVFESEEHKYSYLSSGVTYHDQKWYKYEYNAAGRLTKKYNKYNAQHRTEFVWGWGGESLANIQWYDKDGIEYKRVEFANVWNTTALRMQQPATGLDIYLNIFGKPNKDLPSVEHHYSVSNGVYTETAHHMLNYAMNADSYPTEVKIYNGSTSPLQLVKAIPFAYKVN